MRRAKHGNPFPPARKEAVGPPRTRAGESRDTGPSVARPVRDPHSIAGRRPDRSQNVSGAGILARDRPTCLPSRLHHPSRRVGSFGVPASGLDGVRPPTVAGRRELLTPLPWLDLETRRTGYSGSSSYFGNSDDKGESGSMDWPIRHNRHSPLALTSFPRAPLVNPCVHRRAHLRCARGSRPAPSSDRRFSSRRVSPTPHQLRTEALRCGGSPDPAPVPTEGLRPCARVSRPRTGSDRRSPVVRGSPDPAPAPTEGLPPALSRVSRPRTGSDRRSPLCAGLPTPHRLRPKVSRCAGLPTPHRLRPKVSWSEPLRRPSVGRFGGVGRSLLKKSWARLPACRIWSISSFPRLPGPRIRQAGSLSHSCACRYSRLGRPSPTISRRGRETRRSAATADGGAGQVPWQHPPPAPPLP